MGEKPYVHVWETAGTDGQDRHFGVFALRLAACSVARENGREEDSQLIRQIDFINALYSPETPRTLAIRYLIHPSPGSFSAGRIEIVLLGKVAAGGEATARDRAWAFAGELAAIVGGAMPDHAWESVTDRAVFEALWQPLAWDGAHVAEIRRREDAVDLDTVRPRPVLGRGRAAPGWTPAPGTVYLVHPFKPRSGSLDRILRTLLLAPVPTVWQVSLMAVWLEDSEESALGEEIGKCERYLADAGRDHGIGGSGPLHRRRADMFCQMMVDQLTRLEDAPFLLSVCLASPAPLPRTLVEAVGVEITEPVRTADGYGGGYDVVFPASDAELGLARANVAGLGFADWGESFAPERLRRIRRLVDAREAAGAFRLPLVEEGGLPGLEVRVSRMRPLPHEVAELAQAETTDRVRIGRNDYLGLSHDVYLLERDRRQHMYVVGQTGTGKTTLLKTLIRADMEAGHGLAVIDPHGDLVDELLSMVPRSRLNDVVLFDPTDEDHPIGLNLLEYKDESQRHFVVREMRAIMRRLLHDQFGSAADQWTGPVFFQHMQMNMLLAMSNPRDHGTLLEFFEIFQHKEYWKRWLPLQWSEPQLKRWTETMLPQIDYTARRGEGPTWGEFISSKFDDFVFDPRLRRIFGQKCSSLDFREIMDSGKILLVSLAKGDLTEANAAFLGMVLMAKIQAAAMERVDTPREQRRMFYLYVDEFQSLATDNFSLMLSEARKFGLGLVLANQFLTQIENKRIIQSVFGNVGTIMSFRVGQEDAESLGKLYRPLFDVPDLSNLPNWTACVKTCVAGQTVAPYTLRTILPTSKAATATREEVVAGSRLRYGRKLADVDAEIARSLDVKRRAGAVRAPSEDSATGTG